MSDFRPNLSPWRSKQLFTLIMQMIDCRLIKIIDVCKFNVYVIANIQTEYRTSVDILLFVEKFLIPQHSKKHL